MGHDQKMSLTGRAFHVAALTRRMVRSRGGGFVALQMFGTQILVVALNMASGVITARLLGATGRGLYAAATLWPQALLAIFCVGLPAAITFHMRGTPAAKGTIYTATLLLGTAASAVAVALGLVVVPSAMRSYAPHEILLAQITVLGTAGLIFQLLLRQVSVSLHLFDLFNLSSFMSPLLYVVLLLVVWPTVGVTVQNSVACLYAGIILATALNFWQLRRHCALAVDGLGRWLRNLVSYATRGAIADVLSGISGYIDRLVLVFLITPELLGLYAVAFSFSRLMLVLQTVVNSFVFSKLVGRPRSEIIGLHNQVFRLVAYITLAATIGALLLGKQVLMLLYGREFAAAHLIFFVLTVEAALTCTGQVTAQTLYALNRPGQASIAQTASFATVLVLMLLLAPRFGGMGAAIAMATAALVRAAVLMGGFVALPEARLPRLLPERSDVIFVRRLFSA